jgi:trans-aconitate methyltransferase
MHTAAFDYVARFATLEPISVIEIGSRNYNGTARDHFPAAHWIGIDISAGPCVDVVCDAIRYEPQSPVDLVIACEVFEHASNWRDIIERSATWLRPGGRMIVTCGGTGRRPHSADGDTEMKPFEWYCNVSKRALFDAMRFAGLIDIEVIDNAHDSDTYGTGTNP